MYVGIICASLPSLKAFGAHHFPDLFKSSPNALQPDHERVRWSLLSPVTLHLRTWTGRRTANRQQVDDEETAVENTKGSKALSDTLASTHEGLTRVDTKTSGQVVVRMKEEDEEPLAPP